jgi:tRNA pseudouridine55 synthase
MSEKNICGWIFLDKPIGVSSNYVLQKVRRIFKKCKAGYVGTLDPLASGFLPVALGRATKTIKYLEDCHKGYIFEVLWGVKTSTGDLEGEIEKRETVNLKKTTINSVIRKFLGDYIQVPHKFSSKKINGKRAYDLARKKKFFRLRKQKKKIFSLNVIDFISPSKTRFFVKCSSGTYIRSLVEDMANSVNTFGVLSTLRRIEFGDFDKKLISLDYLLSLGHIEDLLSVVKPVNSVFKTFNQVNLEENEVNNIMNGKPVKIDTVLKMDDNILDRSFTFAKFKDEIIAVGYIKDKSFYPKNLLNGFLSERN